ncbi:AAA domain-containing protein [Rossellomorea vietnamensis]|uniref:AAA domain-containing protein n=1 Tax=Rossellomorea vietnamensis TaxID=218284 RepID=UPI003CECAE4C
MKEQLIHMRDKLNNISRRNRSIRLLKLYNKWSFDLTELDKISDEKVSSKIVEKIVKQSNSDITLFKPSMDNEDTMILSKKLTDLSRNMRGIEEETGVHDFYLGFPFISGTLQDGTFFQAPLFLYPIRLEKNNVVTQKWVVRLDEGEPQLNRTLFLAFKKLNNLSFTEDFFEKAAGLATTLNYDSWINFFKEYDLSVRYTETGIKKLTQFKKDDIPEIANLSLLENAIIGNFPQGGSSLVKDYELLIEKAEEGGGLSLAGELINPEANFGGNEELAETEEVDNSHSQNEPDILNLLQADGSQEEILREARYQKGLVVHGPPGTGKSQVIVNLITDALQMQKKILVVCQKRAALDVVYQRLDSLGLSNHIALVHDEKQDRKKLYTKLSSVLDQNEITHEEAVNMLASASNKLKNQEDLLNSIAKALYEQQAYGFRLYDLYGLANAVGETTQIIELSNILDSLNREELDNISESVYTYAEWYDQFGSEDYILKHRKSFASMDMKEKLQAIELLNGVLEKARNSVSYLESLDHEKITPAYTWMIENKLDKVYPDLDDSNQRTLQGLRLWWWTSFSGKSILEELSNGDKFKGTNSTEWLEIRKSLITMHHLAKETKQMSDEIDKLNKYISDEKIKEFKTRISEGDIPLKELDQITEYFHRDFEELQQMDSYWSRCTENVKDVILKLQSKANQSEMSLPDYWVDLFRNSAYVHWIDQTEKKYPQVQKVSTSEFQRIRESFAQLIEEKRKVATQYLIHSLTKSVDLVQSTNLKKVKELKHQVGKKRMIWSLRKLVNQFAGQGLVDIMPVWLASPEIVSAIFPLEEGLFDLVIFDEASQCTVENGIPAVYRAKQLVVAGDEKQLPPFNMFQSSASSDDEDEEPEFETDESISLLNLSKRRFPEKILQWHYRSKYEELINFSNHAFYNGHVQIAPNVIPFKNPPAIQWKKVNGRWINQSNEIEAIEVVKVLKDLLINQPGKTVGIITFNSKQQSKILDIIDKTAGEDEEFNVLYQQVMSKDLDERIFVKNIENVQGDERDIILFSIGYAKNEEGKIYNRFGMLNQKGGENRLNVAVTRAKEGTIVVSSIDPEELNVTNTAELGPKLFKSYLKYSKAIASSQVEQINAVIQEINENVNTHVKQQDLHFDSPFEEQVYKQLRNLGYEVTTQVGMSGYRIDMAIVHPNDSSKFILGVECDGAMYHSSQNAKERDVYRQAFLESRGWTIERIWSRNWWRNPFAEIERIDQRVKELVKREKVTEKII